MVKLFAKMFSNLTFYVPQNLFYTIKGQAAIAISTSIMTEISKLHETSFKQTNDVLKLRSVVSLEISGEKYGMQ